MVKVFGVTLLSLYILFLILPLILSPIANSYSSQVEDIIKTTTGFDAKIEGLGVVTSPKLSAGVKVKRFYTFCSCIRKSRLYLRIIFNLN